MTGLTPNASNPVAAVVDPLANLNNADYLAASQLLGEETANQSNINFSDLSERSRISAVELEKEGLVLLDLEGDLFNAQNSGL